MTCPYCSEERLIEQIGPAWYCVVCGKSWTEPQRKDEEEQ